MRRLGMCGVDNVKKSLTVNEVLPNAQEEVYRVVMDTVSNNLRVCIPGIIQSFDATTQTVTVQPTIKEQITNPDLSYSWVSLPLLLDVPIVFPRAGGFSLTLPVSVGDECLVVFGDMCIDGWYIAGGTQNTQLDKRRHDLSDGFALVGVWSQPRVLPNYDTSAAQLRTDNGLVSVTVSKAGISLVAPAGSINANGNVLG